MLNTTQTRLQSGVIDLGVGHPGLELLPLQALQQATQHRFAQPDPSFLQYGAEQGSGYFLQALAQFLGQHYQQPVDPRTLLVTGGISQALDLVCTAFAQPGEAVVVEEPSYFLAFGIFKDHGLEVVGVPSDTHGLDIEALEATLKQRRVRLLYTIPSFQNPTGSTLSLERRQRLLELSQEHGFLIVADEVYQLLSYGQAPPPALGCFAHTERVLSLGSFSKILAPGLRLGWVQAAPALLQRLTQHGVVASGGGLNPFTSAMVHSALELGLQEAHLHFLRNTYRARLAALLQALETHLPQARFQRPDGGYFVWLELPHNSTELLEVALSYGVRFQPGPKFSSQGGLHNALRLCFAYYPEHQLTEGVQRLARALNS